MSDFVKFKLSYFLAIFLGLVCMVFSSCSSDDHHDPERIIRVVNTLEHAYFTPDSVKICHVDENYYKSYVDSVNIRQYGHCQLANIGEESDSILIRPDVFGMVAEKYGCDRRNVFRLESTFVGFYGHYDKYYFGPMNKNSLIKSRDYGPDVFPQTLYHGLIDGWFAYNVNPATNGVTLSFPKGNSDQTRFVNIEFHIKEYLMDNPEELVGRYCYRLEIVQEHSAQ